MYHGGFAMIMFNGIPKAAYEGLLLLNELEGGVIGEGEDYIITRTIRKNVSSIRYSLSSDSARISANTNFLTL